MKIAMIYRMSIAAMAIAGAVIMCCGYLGRQAPAAEPDRPTPSDHRPPGPGRMQRAIDEMNLTDGQKQKIEPIVQAYRQKEQQVREEFLKQMKDALTPPQYVTLEKSMRRPPGTPPPQQGNREQPSQENRGAASQPPSEPAAPAEKDPSKVAVTFTGGYDTDPRDHGRPVVLIASALGVSSDVFRDAFSRVKPAAAGREPEPEQVRLNKQTLMHDLSPFGITNERLDTVSNFYRYSGSRGQMWRNTPATAYATIRNRVIVGITITNPGAGYSSPPKVSVTGIGDVKADVTLSFGADFSKNGSIKEIVLKP